MSQDIYLQISFYYYGQIMLIIITCNIQVIAIR